jgi:hypothetical protein
VGNFLNGHNLLDSEEEGQLAGGHVIYMCPSKLLIPAVFQDKQKNVTPKLIYLNNARSGMKKMSNRYQHY